MAALWAVANTSTAGAAVFSDNPTLRSFTSGRPGSGLRGCECIVEGRLEPRLAPGERWLRLSST